jgi:hypothetical protein
MFTLDMLSVEEGGQLSSLFMAPNNHMNVPWLALP